MTKEEKKLPYMEPPIDLDHKFIIKKFIEHEKRIAELEFRLKMLERR